MRNRWVFQRNFRIHITPSSTIASQDDLVNDLHGIIRIVNDKFEGVDVSLEVEPSTESYYVPGMGWVQTGVTNYRLITRGRDQTATLRALIEALIRIERYAKRVGLALQPEKLSDIPVEVLSPEIEVKWKELKGEILAEIPEFEDGSKFLKEIAAGIAAAVASAIILKVLGLG